MISRSGTAVRLSRERDDCQVVETEMGLQLTIDGEPLGVYGSLAAVLETHPEIVRCQPDDCFDVADADLDELVDALRVDTENPEFPGERFDVTINDWTLELALEDCEIPGEHLVSVDTIGAGDVGVSLYRYGPWLEHKFWGDEEQSFGWRIDGEFDAHDTALSFATSGLGEGFGKWDNLMVDSPFLTGVDRHALIDALGPTITDGGHLRLNGEDILGPDVGHAYDKS